MSICISLKVKGGRFSKIENTDFVLNMSIVFAVNAALEPTSTRGQ